MIHERTAGHPGRRLVKWAGSRKLIKVTPKTPSEVPGLPSPPLAQSCVGLPLPGPLELGGFWDKHLYTWATFPERPVSGLTKTPQWLTPLTKNTVSSGTSK